MPTDRRVSRVAALIKREVSQILMQEVKDDRVGSGMVSITDVNVAGDLQHVKIFVSIYGTEEARKETMEGLRAATGYIRSSLGQRVRLRRTPEVIFFEDRSLERGDKMLSLLNRISENSKPDEDPLPRSESSDQHIPDNSQPE
ncbi:ribosome-binding factor A [Lyngbya aestuarii BL J]|uniref:Ribosome-binding factor A n=1 Tax=Lyngbya aestuarii BL J TaxID=1348334 RepID=U7QMQ4_9CYAN|nr:30S ribosome-binding factor RbfA [Lyngbya aestuarii]ERT08547.1 ribosome-binding factor A [Lyngbya aestuarii BL J]